MADPIDMTVPDADVIRILRPRSIFRLLLDLFHLRSDRLRAGDRGATIIDVAQVLSAGQGGWVTSHGPDGDRWSVTVPAAGTAGPGRERPEVR